MKKKTKKLDKKDILIGELLTAMLIHPCVAMKLTRSQGKLIDYQFANATNIAAKYGTSLRFKFTPIQESKDKKCKSLKK